MQRHEELIIDYIVHDGPEWEYHDNTGKIVRCQDYKYWNQSNRNASGNCRCERYSEWQSEAERVAMPPDGYCSNGERKDETK